MKRNPRVNPVLLSRARQMRQESAPAEKKLWTCLRNRQLNGLKFRRQHVAGSYVADFYCRECRVIIELDGDSHDNRESYDTTRTAILHRGGDTVIRFQNEDVFDFTDEVLEAILDVCERCTGGMLSLENSVLKPHGPSS